MQAVQNTPQVVVPFGENTFVFKLEYRNNHGACHYARVFAYLLFIKEMLGIVKPGDVLLETTTGSGGRAAAAIAKALGYAIHVGIPAGGEKARERAIEAEGAILHLTPAERYVDGFPRFVKEFLGQNPDVLYLNHCMGDVYGQGVGVNRIAIHSIYSLVEEVLRDTPRVIDFVVTPLGNGTTTLPFIDGFTSANPEVRIIGVESVASGYAHCRKYAGAYKELLGVEPTDFPRHNMPGTTPRTAKFPMPALEAAIPLLHEVVLVGDERNALRYQEITGKELPNDVVRWDALEHLPVPEFGEFGRSGLAALAVAQRVAKGQVGKTFFVPVLDASHHYDA